VSHFLKRRPTHLNIHPYKTLILPFVVYGRKSWRNRYVNSRVKIVSLQTTGNNKIEDSLNKNDLKLFESYNAKTTTKCHTFKIILIYLCDKGAALIVRRSPDRSPVVSLGIFSEASDKSMCPGLTQLFEMSTRIFLGVKTAGA
jgi:hypothetical protein